MVGARPLPTVEPVFDWLCAPIAVDIGTARPALLRRGEMNIDRSARRNGAPHMALLRIQMKRRVIDGIKPDTHRPLER